MAWVARRACGQAKEFAGVELRHQHRRAAMRQRRQEYDERGVRVEGRRDDRHRAPVGNAGELSPPHAMGLNDAFGRAGRAGRVDDVERPARGDRDRSQRCAFRTQPAGEGRRRRRCRQGRPALTVLRSRSPSRAVGRLPVEQEQDFGAAVLEHHHEARGRRGRRERRDRGPGGQDAAGKPRHRGSRSGRRSRPLRPRRRRRAAERKRCDP